jgi:hypothetical protein
MCILARGTSPVPRSTRVTDLNAGLADVDGDDLAHVVGVEA